MTYASTPARSTNHRLGSRRREVITMMQKIQAVLRRSRRSANPFNGQLLDQKREDVYVEMHRLSFFR